MRLALLLVCALAISTPAAGCSSPYSGKAERLKKPKKKDRDEDEDKKGEQEVAETDKPAADDQCRANFFDEPTKRRSARDGRRLADQAGGILASAERAQGGERATLLVDALDKLTNALKKDPYGPEPTYRMAVAYAMAGRTSCSLKLLDRLNQLQKHPDVEKEAGRAVKRALRDPIFEAFRKEANKALGE